MSAPFVDIETQRAIDRTIDEQAGRIQIEGPMLEVYFPAGVGVRRDVQHGLGTVPTGYQITLEVGGSVRAIDVEQWTPTLAYLEASDAGTRARLFFVTTDVPAKADTSG
jgi:hypothetical protein